MNNLALVTDKELTLFSYASLARGLTAAARAFANAAEWVAPWLRKPNDKSH